MAAARLRDYAQKHASQTEQDWINDVAAAKLRRDPVHIATVHAGLVAILIKHTQIDLETAWQVVDTLAEGLAGRHVRIDYTPTRRSRRKKSP